MLSYLLKHKKHLDGIKDLLKPIGDLARVFVRLQMMTVGPKELKRLEVALMQLPFWRQYLSSDEAPSRMAYLGQCLPAENWRSNG